MAAGDPYFDCDTKKTLSQAFRQMIYDDGEGNPIINIDPNGTTLEPFFNCNERKILSDEQVLRMCVVQDINGNPVFNVNS